MNINGIAHFVLFIYAGYCGYGVLANFKAHDESRNEVERLMYRQGVKRYSFRLALLAVYAAAYAAGRLGWIKWA